jgi:hypothetical protein
MCKIGWQIALPIDFASFALASLGHFGTTNRSLQQERAA